MPYGQVAYIFKTLQRVIKGAVSPIFQGYIAVAFGGPFIFSQHKFHETLPNVTYPEWSCLAISFSLSLQEVEPGFSSWKVHCNKSNCETCLFEDVLNETTFCTTCVTVKLGDVLQEKSLLVT